MAKHDALRELLLAELDALAPHAPLATERELADRHRVSRTTVRQALDGLENDGRVYRIQGSGTFVAPTVVSKSLSLTSFSEDMQARGLSSGSRLLAVDTVAAGRRVATGLGIDPADQVVRITRLRLADGAPMCLENVHLAAEQVPGLVECDLTGSLYELLGERYGIEISSADQVVDAVELEDTEASVLGVPPGSPSLRIRRIGLDRRGTPVEATVTRYRADRYDVRFTVRKGQS